MSPLMTLTDCFFFLAPVIGCNVWSRTSAALGTDLCLPRAKRPPASDKMWILSISSISTAPCRCPLGINTRSSVCAMSRLSLKLFLMDFELGPAMGERGMRQRKWGSIREHVLEQRVRRQKARLSSFRGGEEDVCRSSRKVTEKVQKVILFCWS